MGIERQYLEALELTHQMLAAAVAQDWDALTRLEKQRAILVGKISTSRMALSAKEELRIAAIISDMERESAEIIEQVECWQEHAKILLRLKKPTS